MSVLNLKKNAEVSVLITLTGFMCLLFILLKYMPLQTLSYEIVLVGLIILTTIFIFLLVTRKRDLMLCPQGVFYRSIWGQVYVEAHRAKLIRHYSKFGFNWIIIRGDKLFIFAPFYSVTSKQIENFKLFDFNFEETS